MPRAGRAFLSRTFGRYSFPRERRLRKQAQFRESLRRRVATGTYFQLFASRNGGEFARLGLVAGKKGLPLAVQRNRSKRLVRDMFRGLQDRLAGFDVVVRARRPIGPREAPLARQELQRLLGALAK